MSATNTGSLSSAEIKSRLSALTKEELKALESTYHYYWRIGWLRINGWINLFLGGLTLWLGISCPCGFTFLRTVQTLAGVLIVGQSLWAIVSTSTAGFLRFAIVLLMVGIYNTLLAISSGFFEGGVSLVGLLGLLQLWWAFQTYKIYRRFRQMVLSEPQNDIARFYDEVAQAIFHGKLKNDTSVINLWVGRNKWRGLLLEDKLVFAANGHLIIQPKEHPNFVPNSSNPMRKKRIYGRIKLDDFSMRAMMKRDSFEKYAHWKGLEEILLQVTPSLWQRLPRAIRVALMIIGGTILLYLVFMVIGMIALVIEYT